MNNMTSNGRKTDLNELLEKVKGKAFTVYVVESDSMDEYATCIKIEDDTGYFLIGSIFKTPKEAQQQTREITKELAEMLNRNVDFVPADKN